jgi:quercetin dioxygenase-like cupin family protein
MADAGQVLRGQGVELQLIRTAAETDGELLEMEAAYAGTGTLPPEHLHPRQAERFEVLEGTIRAIVAGVERRYGRGETFEVPAGTPHQMAAVDGPARMLWEVRPALRTAEFFERLYGESDRSIGDLLSEFDDEIRLT